MTPSVCAPGTTRALTVESRVFSGTPNLLGVRSGPAPVGHLAVPLAGAYVARRHGIERSHELGGGLVDPGLVYDERWEGARFRMLCAEWTLDHGRPIPRSAELAMSTIDLGRLQAFADALCAGRVDDRAIDDVVRTLRSIGVPLEPLAGALLGPAPRRAVELAGVLSELHTRLHAHPDLTDVEAALGISARQIRRHLASQGAWAVTAIPTWRSALRRTRALLAPSLATARGATVERIARALGYRSATALLFALDAEGVPPPAVARRLTFR